MLVKSRVKKAKEAVLSTAEFTLEELSNQLIRLPRPGEIQAFSLRKHPPFKTIYNLVHKNLVVVAGRQVGKSTYLGVRALVRCALIPNLTVLYVSPTYMQTAKFSNDKLTSVLNFSDKLNILKGGMKHDAILSKKFANRSEIVLRAAYRSAERIRGITAFELYVDEFQDFLPDLIPVLEECLHTAPPELRTRVYTGTFKAEENILTHYYYNLSARYEWLVPCYAHTPTYWNLPGEKNIGEKGFICQKCGKLLNPGEGRWVLVDGDLENKYFVGFRLPQIIFPIDWKELLSKRKRYPPAAFYNECLALPYDVAERALTKAELLANCDSRIGINREFNLEYWKRHTTKTGAYAGVDWGFGTQSYSVLTLGTFVDDKFVYFYFKRYEGTEAAPEFMLEDIIQQCRYFNARFIGLDFGFGFGLNDKVRRDFDPRRTYTFEYVGRQKRKAVWSKTMERFLLDRTEVLGDFFDAIKRRDTIRFPHPDEFMDPFGRNFLAVRKEVNKSLKKLTFTHSPAEPDDAVHACLYAFLVSCLDRPRPHFFSPIYED